MQNRREFMKTSIAMGTAALATASASSTMAQLISQPSRLVIGFPAGGSADTIARLLAQQLGSYASSLIVENKPGAGGRIGLETVKGANPDGTVMCITPASMLVLYPHVFKSLNYDPVKDFQPVANVCKSEFALTVGPLVPESVKTLKEFVAWCEEDPTRASYGTSAAGSMPHFAGLMLAKAAGFDFRHIPYKGAAPAIQDLLGGQIAANIAIVSTSLPHVRAGKLRALATSGATRSDYLPEAPNFVEAGFPDLVVEEWFGLLLPAATPEKTVGELNAAVAKALQQEKLRKGLSDLTITPVGGSSAELAALIASDMKKWAGIVKDSGVKLEQ